MSELPLNVNEFNAKMLKENDVELGDKYFPKSGGALSGDISFNRDDTLLKICGATSYNNGAFINLIGKDFYDDSVGGTFELCATKNYNSNIYGILKGYPNGDLTWKTNVKTTDLGASAIVAKNLGDNGYIKYASGLIIQWGFVENHDLSNTINFNIAFSKGTCSVSLTPADQTKDYSAICNGCALHSFTYTRNSPNAYLRWVAIGI